jgi:hypothetical protein
LDEYRAILKQVSSIERKVEKVDDQVTGMSPVQRSSVVED